MIGEKEWRAVDKAGRVRGGSGGQGGERVSMK